MANQREILEAQNALVLENQKKNALLKQQLAQQRELQRNINEMTKETIKLTQTENKKADEIAKLKENVSEAREEIKRLQDELKD